MRRWSCLVGLAVLVTCLSVGGGTDMPVRLAPPGVGAQSSASFTKQFEETTYYLRDITLLTPEVGWAVGFAHWDQAAGRYTSTILKTVDGGATWTCQAAGSDADLNAVYFLDERTGWAVGGGGVILRTVDSGATWEQALAGDGDLQDVIFTDAQSGWVTSTKPIQFDEWSGEELDWQAAIWHTTDGGATWVQQAVPQDASLIRGIDFTDGQTGWAAGSKRVAADPYRPEHAGVVYHTADGGATWSEVYSPDLPVAFKALDFVDAQQGWVVGFPTSSTLQGGCVFHTADGGASWERQEPGGWDDLLWDVRFVDGQRGYVVGANYVSAWGPPVWRTFDGGATWHNIRMETHAADGLYGMAIAGDRLIAVGDHDFVCESTAAWAPATSSDGAELFTQRYLNPHYRFEDVYFVDDQVGWAVGRRTYTPEHWGQVILATSDGGEHWSVQYEHAPPDSLFSVHRLNAVHFVDRLHGWAVGRADTYDPGPGGGNWLRQDAVLSTTDGGQTWQPVSQEFYNDQERELFDVQFLDAAEGWALAADYLPSRNVHLAHTLDGGRTWSWVDTGIEGPLAIGFELVQGELVFVDRQQGWAVGGLGTIVHTADGGQTWSQQALSCGYPTCPWSLHAVDFIDAQQGWIAGEGFFRTTDGGQTWLPVTVETEGRLNDIDFVNAQVGWAVGDWGQVWGTSDSGTSWELLDSGTLFNLLGMHFLSNGEGWIVGEFGTILHYAAGG